MASSALIDDLLKQFAENPRRVFARLANEYRKNGELDTAIEICRAHVPLQPTYISGYIVLGQALYESGQLEEARSTFETALGLDPENLIALRQLGDVARANGDLTGARAWYRRLLEVDPQNEEIATQVRDLDSPSASAPAATPQADSAGVSWNDIHPEHAPPTPELPTVHVITPSDAAPAQHLDLDFDVLSAFSTDSEPASTEAAPPVVSAPERILTPPETEPLAAAADNFAPPVRDDADAVEEEPALGREHIPEPPAPKQPVAPVEMQSVHASAPADAQDEPLPAAFITETMAELYLQQGHVEQALDIYRLLAAQRPGDLSLLNRIARLESTTPVAQSERTVRAFFGRFSQRRPPGATPAAGVAAAAAAPAAAVQEYKDERVAPVGAEAKADTQAPAEHETVPAFAAPEAEMPATVSLEPSILEFAAIEPEPVQQPGPVGSSEPVHESASSFARLFSGRGTSAADEQAATTLAGAFVVDADTSNGVGRPARAATDALSLDDVFGGGAAQHESGAVSFDDFFATPNGATAAPQPSGGSSAMPSAPQRTDDADLELFHAWLEGLKK